MDRIDKTLLAPTAVTLLCRARISHLNWQRKLMTEKPEPRLKAKAFICKRCRKIIGNAPLTAPRDDDLLPDGPYCRDCQATVNEEAALGG